MTWVGENSNSWTEGDAHRQQKTIYKIVRCAESNRSVCRGYSSWNNKKLQTQYKYDKKESSFFYSGFPFSISLFGWLGWNNPQHMDKEALMGQAGLPAGHTKIRTRFQPQNSRTSCHCRRLTPAKCHKWRQNTRQNRNCTYTHTHTQKKSSQWCCSPAAHWSWSIYYRIKCSKSKKSHCFTNWNKMVQNLEPAQIWKNIQQNDTFSLIQHADVGYHLHMLKARFLCL